jgi:hypothetical protein
MNIKTIIATAALAAVVASPALAQTSRRATSQQPSAQSDQTYGRTEGQPRATNSANDVYDGNRYLGADPDPNVRMQLRLDAEHRDF